MTKPIRIGIIGMGGFAGSHHDLVKKLESEGRAALAATCDPDPDRFAAERRGWALKSRGVKVFRDYQDMLRACGEEMDMVVVPTPIPLHAPMHRAAVEAGLAVYLEKPPTLDHAELETMISVDGNADKKTFVGFNFINEPQRQALKERLLKGEFGPLRRAALYAFWPRPSSYFRRCDWVGRLMLDDTIILDSCLGNAMAHFVHNMLFWTGQDGLLSWSSPETVEAEIYRAHEIEGADTFFVRADTDAGVPLFMALSHACDRRAAHPHEEVVSCEKAEIVYRTGRGWEIRWHDGEIERGSPSDFESLRVNHLTYYDYLLGRTPRPVTTLADCRPFVTLNGLAYLAAGRIHRITEEHRRWRKDEIEQRDYVFVPGLEDAARVFLASGQFPSRTGRPWAAPGGRATPADMTRFESVIRDMARDAASPHSA